MANVIETAQAEKRVSDDFYGCIDFPALRQLRKEAEAE
jgi:hypothetical protein